MIIVRDAQMQAFSEQAIARFEDTVVGRLKGDHLPKFELVGEPSVRKLIRKAIETGRPYGIVGEGPVSVLIELMFLFGEKLELSPHKAWAWNMMAHPTLPDYLKMDMVWERVGAPLGGRTLMTLAPSQKKGA